MTLNYLTNEKQIKNFIEKANTVEALKSFYELCLHYNYSLEYFIKQLFIKDLNNCGSTIILRESNSASYSVITSYFSTYGGNFKPLIDYIVYESKKHSVKKSLKLVIEYLDKYLINLLSPDLVDFCITACRLINERQENEGLNFICNFIFFNIIFPKILSVDIKLLKLINELKKIINEKNDIQNIIARAMMSWKKPSYKQEKILTTKQLDYRINIVLSVYDKLPRCNSTKDSKRSY